MLKLHRALAQLCPSVPRAQRARILAATQIRDSQAPVDGLRGEAEPSAGDRPEGGEGSFLSFSSTPLSGPKPLHPSMRADLTDERLAALLSEWGAPS